MSPSELIGYADRISAAPGGTVGFKVSTDLARFDAAIVRLIHGDANGPGFKEELVAELGPRHGRKQHAVAGSYGRIAHSAALEPAHGFSLAAWAFPTMPAGGVQAIAAKWSRGSGYALVIGSDGQAELWLGDGARIHRIGSGAALRERRWHFLSASFDPAEGTIRIVQAPLSPGPDEGHAEATGRVPENCLAASGTPLTFAALALEAEAQSGGLPRPSGLYNGKIGQPALFDRVPGRTRAEGAARGGQPPRHCRSRRLLGFFARHLLVAAGRSRSPPAARQGDQHADARRHRTCLDGRGDRFQARPRRIRRHPFPRRRPGGRRLGERFRLAGSGRGDERLLCGAAACGTARKTTCRSSCGRSAAGAAAPPMRPFWRRPSPTLPMPTRPTRRCRDIGRLYQAADGEGPARPLSRCPPRVRHLPL